MNNYEATFRQHPDYSQQSWHGGIYIGNSSRGRILPNAFFRYSKGKWDMKGELNLDFSDLATSKHEEATYDTGLHKETTTQTTNRYEHQDLTFHADYHATKYDILSFDVFEKYHHDRINDNTVQSGNDADGNPLDSKYEEQGRQVSDFNFGTLVEHTHRFQPGGSLASRIYFKYDNKPTTVTKNTWGTNAANVSNREEQTYTSADPKAQVVYLSPEWGGFSFGVREKVGCMNMRIEDTASNFHYNVRESLTSMGADYKHNGLSLNIGAGYEIFHHDIEDFINPNVSHTYHDWLYNASATYKMHPHHRLNGSYKHNITRPTYTQLYPFVHIGSSIASWVVGNPNLLPSTNDQWQIKYTYDIKPLTLNAIVTYKKTLDDITRISVYNEGTDRWVKTWVNDATYNTLRMALEGELRVGALSMTMGAHAQYLHYSGENISGDQAWSYSFKVRPQLSLHHDWTLACVALYTGREVHLHEYNRAQTYLAFRVFKQLGDWGIYAFVQDILRADNIKVLQGSDNTIVTTTDYNARALVLGCSYRF